MSLAIVALFAALAVNASAGNYTPLPGADPIEPDPWIAYNVTKDDHKTGWTVQNYEDDSNALKALAADVDDRVTEPYTLDLADTYAPGVIQENVIAHAGTCGSDKWNETGCWVETETGGGAGTVTTTTVDGFGFALRFKHIGAAAASDTVYKYDAVDISADFAKTRFIIGVRVHQVDASSEAYISVVNSGGNLKSYLIDDAGTLYENTTCNFRIHSGVVVSTAVGNPAFYDDKPADFGGVCTYTNQDIAEIRVQLKDVHATIAETIDFSLVALRIDTKQLVWGKTTAGKDVANQTIAQPTRSMASFAPTFIWSRIGDFKVALRGWAHNLAGSSFTVTSEPATTGDFIRLVHYRFDFKLPLATDLVYANAKLQDALTRTKDHYDGAAVNGVDKTELYTCSSCKVGSVVTLTDPTASDTVYATLIDVMYTEAEWDAISAPTGGVVGQVEFALLGGLILFLGLIGLGAGGIALGLRRRRANIQERPFQR